MASTIASRSPRECVWTTTEDRRSQLVVQTTAVADSYIASPSGAELEKELSSLCVLPELPMASVCSEPQKFRVGTR